MRAPIESSAVREKLKNFVLADPKPTRPEKSPIDILIGNDFYDLIVQSRRHEIDPGKLWLKESLLGWILSGRATAIEEETCHLAVDIGNMALYATQVTKSHGLFESEFPVNGKIDVVSNYSKRLDFSDLWNLDSIGIKDSPTESDDKVALEFFENSIERRDKRYYVRLPWISDKPQLPTNSAIGRLKTTQKRHGQQEVWDKVNDIIQDQEEKGIIEKVSQDQSEQGLIHYIPHQIATRDDSVTTKVRLVFDASAKTKKSNLSLNECLIIVCLLFLVCLLRGPVTIKDLPGILICIRFNPILTIYDIQAAFLQVGIQEVDRDCTRFYWIKDKFQEPYGDNLITCRFARLPFGIISSPFLLSQTNTHPISQSDSPFAKKIAENLYVDNVFACFDSVDEVLQFYHFAKVIFQEASMNLRHEHTEWPFT